MKMNQKILLREYIRQSIKNKLNEDTTEFNASDYASTSSNYIDSSFYSSNSNTELFLNAFVTPFTDVFKTAVAGVKQITADIAVLMQIAFEVVLTTVMPFISADYKSIFERRDQKMEEIRGEYADVFERTDEAFKDDAQLIGFMLNPAIYLGSKAAIKSTVATKELLSIATQGVTDSALDAAKSAWYSIQNSLSHGELDKKRAQSEKSKIYKELIDSIGSSRNKFENRQMYSLRALLETSDDEKGSFDDFLADMLKNPSVVQALSQKIKENPRMKDITKKLSDIENETLKSAEESAQRIIRDVSSLDGIKNLAKKNPKGKKALDQIKDPESTKLLISNTKKSTSQVFTTILSTRMNMLPKDSQEYKEYQKTLQKVSKY